MLLNSVIFESGSSVGAILESIKKSCFFLRWFLQLQEFCPFSSKRCFSLRGGFTATEVGRKDVVPQK